MFQALKEKRSKLLKTQINKDPLIIAVHCSRKTIGLKHQNRGFGYFLRMKISAMAGATLKCTLTGCTADIQELHWWRMLSWRRFISSFTPNFFGGWVELPFWPCSQPWNNAGRSTGFFLAEFCCWIGRGQSLLSDHLPGSSELEGSHNKILWAWFRELQYKPYSTFTVWFLLQNIFLLHWFWLG